MPTELANLNLRMPCKLGRVSLPQLKSPWQVVLCSWGGWPVDVNRAKSGKRIVSQWFCAHKCRRNNTGKNHEEERRKVPIVVAGF